jgi:hypothetical protein
MCVLDIALKTMKAKIYNTYFLYNKKKIKVKTKKNIGYIIIENNHTNTFPCDTFLD